MNKLRIILSLAVVIASASLKAQSLLDKADTLAAGVVSMKYLEKASSKAASLEQKLDDKSVKVLEKFQKQEQKMIYKLAKKDSSKAAALATDAKQRYEQLEQKLKKAERLKSYIPSLDTLSSSIKFLQENQQLLATAKDAGKKLKETSEKISNLQNEFQKAEEIKQFLRERKEYLKQQLQGLDFAKQFKKLNKEAYYYSQQLKEYKEVLKDHSKAEKKAIELLSRTKVFKDFMRRNSQLAALFRLPGDPTDPTTQASLAGLQTRAQVNGLIQQQIAAGGPNAQQQLQQNLQQAKSKLNELKDKITQYGGGSSDDIMPEGFKPNDQKTKTFLQRLEYGVNMQSQKANGYFPVTSDIGLSIGYKLNDKSVIGIGASYKMGWGPNIQHIKITHEGVGLRSFIDWKIKGSFWVSGGYEMNYRTAFNHVDELKDLDAWQQSGLIGISKQVSLRSKILKKTKLQLLWDFLSYQQEPRTQAVLFRVGYNF